MREARWEGGSVEGTSEPCGKTGTANEKAKPQRVQIVSVRLGLDDRYKKQATDLAQYKGEERSKRKPEGEWERRGLRDARARAACDGRARNRPAVCLPNPFPDAPSLLTMRPDECTYRAAVGRGGGHNASRGALIAWVPYNVYV